MTTLRFDKMYLDTIEKENLSVYMHAMGYGVMTNPECRDEGVIYLKKSSAYDFTAAEAYLNNMCIPHYESTQEIQVL